MLGTHFEFEGRRFFCAGWRHIEADAPILPTTVQKALIDSWPLITLGAAFMFLIHPALLGLSALVALIYGKILEYPRGDSAPQGASRVTGSLEYTVVVGFFYEDIEYARDEGTLVLDRANLIYSGKRTTFSFMPHQSLLTISSGNENMTVGFQGSSFRLAFTPKSQLKNVLASWNYWVYNLPSGKREIKTFFVPPLVVETITPLRWRKRLTSRGLRGLTFSLCLLLPTICVAASSLGILSGNLGCLGICGLVWSVSIAFLNASNRLAR